MDHSPRWPLWLPLAAVGFGLSAQVLLLAVVTGVAHTTKGHGITIVATVIVDVTVVVSSVLLAGLVTRPRPAQFGLRGASLKFAAQMAGLGALAYFLFSILYGAIVRPHNPQRVVEDLGADTSKFLLVVGAVVVITVAPVCEELFFRGLLFTVLRQRMPLWPAAVIDGVLF